MSADQLGLFDEPALPARHETGTVREDWPTVCRTTEGQFVIVQYSLSPKQGAEKWVFPLFWDGPGTHSWRGTSGTIGHVPRSAHRYTDLAAARSAAEQLARGEQ